jgi:hypothetical protein
MAGNVGDCLAALIQTMLRDGDTQRDSAAMGALGRLSKLGMTLRDGSAVSLRLYLEVLPPQKVRVALEEPITCF